jgi:adenylate cyclase
MAEERARRRLAAILAADVVGYSRLMQEDEPGTLSALKVRRKELLEPTVAGHRGRIFKVMGDGVLIEFASAVDAVECAVAIRHAMGEANAGVPLGKRIELRIGVNLGDVMVEGSDLYGDGVNLASRLQEIAEPGDICVSAKVREEVEGKAGLAFEDLGERKLKNIAIPARVHRVPSGGAPPTGSQPLPLPDKPSIVVLPFDNLSGDPEQQYFSDGIAEDIITDLSKISGLFVIARNSAFTYRGRAVKVPEVSRELGVRYVLEGSVRKAGNRVRIAAQLIDGTTGGHLWAERYDRDLADIFAVQDEVTREIVSALAVRLTQGEERRLKHKGTENLDAYDLYLRGRELMKRRNREANEEARPLLERAIALDPAFAGSYSMLALVHLMDYVNRWREPPEEWLHVAREFAQKGVAHDEDSAEAHWALGLTYLSDRQLDPVMAEARKALALDPNFAWAHSLLGQALLYAGHWEDSIAPLRAAIRLDPNFDSHLHYLAQAYFGLAQYEEAAANLRRRILRKPDSDLSRVLLAACYGHLGKAEEAKALWQEVFQVNPNYSLEHHCRVLPYKNAADLQRFIDGLRKVGLPD